MSMYGLTGGHAVGTDEEHKAATKIQAVHRGRQARKDLASRK